MRAVRIAAALIIGPLAYAQAVPDIALPPGDAARGKSIFESSSKGNCSSCHRVQGTGSLFGPDLSTVAIAPAVAGRGGAAGGRGGQGVQGSAPAAVSPQQLAQSILDPNAVVTVANRYVALKMRDGKTISGKLLSIDTFYVQILDSTEKLANIARENVRDMTMTSPMPSYRDKLTTQELSDVVSYLMTLKGQ
jgi:mono/diheme cytochrome c family protein